jgi:hypothetical protein
MWKFEERKLPTINNLLIVGKFIFIIYSLDNITNRYLGKHSKFLLLDIP